MIGTLSEIERQKLTPGNRVTVLRDGDEYFPAICKSIQDAKHYILIEQFIYRNDRTGAEVGSLLAQKALEGVKVYVIADWVGSFDTPDEFFREFEKHGIEFGWFNPISMVRRKFRPFNLRTHRKIVVCDGSVGYLGGMNIADDYRSVSDGGRGWRDTSVRIEGPAVKVLVDCFVQAWARSSHVRIPYHSLRQNKIPRGDANCAIIDNTLRNSRRTIRRVYAEAIKRAETEILITNAYFLPDRKFLSLLRKKSRAGVKVRLLLPGVSDVRFFTAATRHLYRELLDDGVEIYEFQNRVMHAKTCVVDEIWSTVGSFNLDQRSIRGNLEINAVFFSAIVAKTLRDQFEDDLKTSKRILVEDIENRPWTEKLAGWFLYRLRALL
ncbi:MAG: phospholipase D-like domain-containing protein [Planctomycetes bacterium]|nr:phospholipase D-like domain-containing protein [Planctomycetota bacterium]